MNYVIILIYFNCLNLYYNIFDNIAIVGFSAYLCYFWFLKECKWKEYKWCEAVRIKRSS